MTVHLANCPVIYERSIMKVVLDRAREIHLVQGVAGCTVGPQKQALRLRNVTNVVLLKQLLFGCCGNRQ